LKQDFWKCALAAKNALTVHAAESRELNEVCTMLSRDSLKVLAQFQEVEKQMLEIQKKYPNHAHIPTDVLRRFESSVVQAEAASIGLVELWKSPTTRKKLFDDRELFALEQIADFFKASTALKDDSNEAPLGAVMVYGGEHDFPRHLNAFKTTHPDIRLSCIVLTPRSYRDSN